MSKFGGPSSKSRKRTRLCSESRTLVFEQLEDRRVLANLVAVDAYLVDGTGTNVLSDVVVGQQIGVRLDWTTIDLPSNIADYQVEFRVDGVPLRSDAINFGAGQSMNSPWWYQIGWYASPGIHTVEVIVDVDEAVLESNESDNTITFDFTPVTASFPQRMIWPMGIEPQTESFWTNYNDVDPTSGFSDHTGGDTTYDGHNAIDAGPVPFVGQDVGIEIYAALGGVVKTINDGEFDRQTVWTSASSNHVVIDHGNGWETSYLHMRRDSVQVEVGQIVSQGDRLGLVGSSGRSSGAHIHFELQRHGLAVETYYDPSTYWVSPVDYVGDNVYLIDSGITNYNPGGQHFWEGPSDAHIFAQQSGITLYARGYYSGLRSNDLLQSVWRRPNGTVYTTRSFNISEDFSSSGWYWGSVDLPTTPNLGIWQVDYRVNGILLGHDFFEVTTNGEPEIRVDEPNGDIVLDGRFTPYDFGTVNVGSSSPTQTFTVINHGYDTLTIDSLEVPTGFTVTNGLPASLAPGASDTLTVALDTSTGGYFGGEIRIASNDTDESIYNFAVEGIVTSGGVENLLVGIGEFEVEEGDQMIANIRRTGSNFFPLTVTLSTNDATELSLPNTVSFASGEDYVQFFFDAPSDLEYDGNQRAAIVASAAGYYNGRKTVEIVDDRQQLGDFTGDSLVNGSDFLEWQRGASPNPLSTSDLIAWQENYGNLPPQVSASSRDTPVAVQLGTPTTASTSSAIVLPFFAAQAPFSKLSFAQIEAVILDQADEIVPRYDTVPDSAVNMPVRNSSNNGGKIRGQDLPQDAAYHYDFDEFFAVWGQITEYDQRASS